MGGGGRGQEIGGTINSPTQMVSRILPLSLFSRFSPFSTRRFKAMYKKGKKKTSEKAGRVGRQRNFCARVYSFAIRPCCCSVLYIYFTRER